jgi:hypothetical protein
VWKKGLGPEREERKEREMREEGTGFRSESLVKRYLVHLSVVSRLVGVEDWERRENMRKWRREEREEGEGGGRKEKGGRREEDTYYLHSSCSFPPSWPIMIPQLCQIETELQGCCRVGGYGGRREEREERGERREERGERKEERGLSHSPPQRVTLVEKAEWRLHSFLAII